MTLNFCRSLFKKYNYCLWECWFLAKNLSDFVYLPPFKPWKLVNPYYHSICLVKSFFESKPLSHHLHLWGFFLSWTAAMCFFILDFWEKHEPQREHSKGFMPSWTTKICFFKFDLSLNSLLHISQVYTLPSSNDPTSCWNGIDKKNLK